MLISIYLQIFHKLHLPFDGRKVFDALTRFYVQPTNRKPKIKNKIYSKFIVDMAYNIAKDNVARKNTQCNLYYYFTWIEKTKSRFVFY